MDFIEKVTIREALMAYAVCGHGVDETNIIGHHRTLVSRFQKALPSRDIDQELEQDIVDDLISLVFS